MVRLRERRRGRGALLKISINLVFTEDERRLIAADRGYPGPAPVDMIRAWVGGALRADMDRIEREAKAFAKRKGRKK